MSMTVGELIAELKNYPYDREVLVVDKDWSFKPNELIQTVSAAGRTLDEQSIVVIVGLL